MKKYREVIGMPVLSAQEGKKLGNIKDIIFSVKEKQVKAFVLEKKAYKMASKGFLFEDVKEFGEDAVIVKDYSNIVLLNKLGPSKSKYKGRPANKDEICGRKVYTKTGRELGIVEDILFDTATGRVEGVEISDGIFEDVMQGRNILPLFGNVEFSEENIMVSREAVEEMVSTGGGIIKRLSKQATKKY